MAVNLNGVNQYLFCNFTAHASSYPFTMAGWMYTTNLNQIGVLVGIDDDSVLQNCIHFRGTEAGDYLAAATYATGWALAYTSTGVSSGTWHHFMAVYNSATDRRIYIDGASKGTDTANQDASAATDLNIGCRYGHTGGAAASLHFEGKLAHVGVWTSALSDANAVSLATGLPPTLVDAANLEEYWALIDDGNSDGGNVGTNLSANNTPTYDSDDPLSGILAATGIVTFSGVAGLTKQTVVGGTQAGGGGARLIAIGNDELWYEDID
jgi:hypothetical protein